MASPYSMDFRKRVVKLVEEGHSPDEVAESLDVSRAWVYRLMQRYREEGNFEAKKMGTKTPPKLTEHKEELRKLVKEHPDATLKELQEKLPIKISIGALFNALRREGITLKKKSSTRLSGSGRK